MASEILLHIRPSTNDGGIKYRLKTPPLSSKVSVPFAYAASDDGTDENLLILLHGLGDTHIPFGNLGRQLKLPQTATLALRAPQQIPFLEEKAFQWYPSFDELGDIIERPDPTSALNLLTNTLIHLVEDCGWAPQNIHLFGFAQGGSVAAEGALRWWRQQLERSNAKAKQLKESDGTPDEPTAPIALGSLVTVSGPLLSHPTLSRPCPTPALVFHRPASGAESEFALSASDISSFRKGFSQLKEVKLSGNGMPRSRDEWQSIMEFWSQRLSKRPVEGLYEVLSGSSA